MLNKNVCEICGDRFQCRSSEYIGQVGGVV